MTRSLIGVLLSLLLASSALADQTSGTLTGFIGKVVGDPGPSGGIYRIDLYQGSSTDPVFYAKRKFITSSQTDADGNFLIVASNLALGYVTLRASNASSRLSGDSIYSSGSNGWPPVVPDIVIKTQTLADPRFGINTNNYARQTMYFVTDRLSNGTDFANTADPNQTPSFGSFLGHVALGPGQAVGSQCGIATDWKCDGRQATNDDGFIDNIATAATGDNAKSKLAAALNNPVGNTVLLFVHGYNNSFDQGGATVARLSYLMEPALHTTLLYSWPSQARIHGYPQDKNSADKSAKANLVWVLDELANLPSHPTIILVAHSMGAYALTTALWEWSISHPEATGTFDKLILFASDLDVSLWSQTYAPSVGRVVRRVRFYGNVNDQALRASKCMTGDDTDRVGQIVVWMPTPGIDLTSFDATRFASTSDYGHGYITSSFTVALDWNSITDEAPMSDLKERMAKLAWLEDGGGGVIDFARVQTSALCAIWKQLP
jgi:esterase/lipase superfamily enzyme